MSSTYAHYQGPASLPSDYAILSRYAAHHNESTSVPSDGIVPRPQNDTNRHNSGESGDGPYDSVGEVLQNSLSGQYSDQSLYHRQSFQTPYSRPSDMTIGVPDNNNDNLRPIPSENTPLLTPAIPRIEEDVDRDPSADNDEKLKMFWEEFRILAKYSLPVFGTHLLEYTLVTASVITIGHLSTNALAAISLGSMTASVTGFSVIQGLTSALDTMLPAAWTSNQPNLVGLWSQRMTVLMSACLIPMLMIWVNAEPILLRLKQEPEVARLAGVYLRWVSFGLPAYAFNCISRRYFQSQGLFDVPTRIIFIVAPINAVLNYTLVWGPENIRLGFIGAPIATAISFNLVSLMSIAYGIFFVDRRAWYPLSHRMFTGLGLLARLGFSGVGQVASEWWAWELVALAASLLGPVYLATQSVLLVSSSTTFQAPFALGVATSVRIGNLLGELKAKRAEIAAKAAIVMALVVAALTSAMFYIFRNRWAYMFNSDPVVVKLVADILPLVALFQVFDGTAAVASGILRAIGKQFTGALLNLSAYYFFGIPFGIWLAFSWDLGLHGLWIGLTISLVYCAVLGTFICLSTNWNREVEKVVERLREDKMRHGDDAENGVLHENLHT